MTDPNQVVCAGAIASPEASRAEAWGALGPRPQLRTIHLEREFFVCRKLRRKRAQKHLFAHCKEFTQNFEYTCRLLSALGSGAVRWSLLGLGVLICPLTGITKNQYNNLRDGSGCSTSETDMQLRKSCPRLWPSSMCVHPASRSSSLPGLEPAGDLESTAGVLQPRPLSSDSAALSTQLDPSDACEHPPRSHYRSSDSVAPQRWGPGMHGDWARESLRVSSFFSFLRGGASSHQVRESYKSVSRRGL